MHGKRLLRLAEFSFCGLGQICFSCDRVWGKIFGNDKIPLSPTVLACDSKNVSMNTISIEKLHVC